MGINKIIDNLESLFEKDEINNSNCKTLDDLLKELEKQKEKIKAKIDSESSKKKRKKLKMKLKIIEVQLRKGNSKREAAKAAKGS